jgi:hypothetical protein
MLPKPENKIKQNLDLSDQLITKELDSKKYSIASERQPLLENARSINYYKQQQ